MKRSCAPSSRRTRRADPERSLALAAVAALAACDRGVPEPATEVEPVHVLGVSVGDGRPLYDGDAIVISFDRFLDPRTATRQSFAVVDAFNTLTPNPLVIYDPATRTVTLASAEPEHEWLVPDQPYTLILGIPAPGQFLGGVRGLDGGTLTPDQNRTIGFFARSRPAPPPAEPPVSFCEQVQPLFAKACVRCHDGSTSGLDLRDAAGIRATALGVAAHGGNRAALPGPTPPTEIFGQGAALLDPPSAGTSYLLSTVLAREPGSEPSRAFCTAPARATPLPPVPFLDDPGPVERERLASYLGGSAMPPPDAAEAPLTPDERRLLSQWIREGASVQPCSTSCP